MDPPPCRRARFRAFIRTWASARACARGPACSCPTSPTPRTPKRPHKARAHAHNTRARRTWTPRAPPPQFRGGLGPQRIFIAPLRAKFAQLAHLHDFPARFRTRTHAHTPNQHAYTIQVHPGGMGGVNSAAACGYGGAAADFLSEIGTFSLRRVPPRSVWPPGLCFDDKVKQMFVISVLDS